MINEELEDQFELDPDEIGDDEESGDHEGVVR